MHTTAKTMIPVALLLAAATFVGPASAQGVGPYEFEKKAFKPDGTPWTGPVHVGDIIKYVLSYKPGTTNSGPVTIVDKLSSNQTYVAPTKASDALWTWGTAPYSTANTETYKHPGFGPGTGTVKVTVSGNPAPTHDVGDGTKPIPVKDRVFGVYHHALFQADPGVDCWDLQTLAKCPGYPKVNTTPIATPQEASAVVRGTKIFFAGARGSASGALTIGCFDTSTDSFCPDTLLSGSAGGYQTFGGLAEDAALGANAPVFAVLNNKVFCRIWNGSAWDNCPGVGWLPTGTDAVPTAPTTSFHPIFNVVSAHAASSRVYVHVGGSVVQCLDVASGNVCASWPPAGVTLNSNNPIGGTFSAVPAGAGENGVCLWTLFLSEPVGCVDQNGALLSNPGAVGGTVVSTFRIPGTGRTYFGQHNGDGRPVCMDYTGTAGGACAGFVSAAPAPIGTDFALTYGFALDPRNEKCMLALGHTNWLWRFDWKTGQVGCETPEIVQTPKIEDLYCNGTPTLATFQWTTIRVLTAGAVGTLTITKGTGTPFPQGVSFGTTTPMPAGIGAGYGQLSFSYVPDAGSPTTVDLEIGYVSDKKPEICYQAQVKCGPVFNDATFNDATFTGSFNGAAVNVSQKVDLGVVDSPQCRPTEVTGCLQDMKAEVKCNPDGTYTVTLAGSGFAANEIAMTSLTPGVTVTPAKQPWSATMTWTITGATAGQALTLSANATKIGGGSAEGIDQCCSGEIKVVMPECPVDVKIDKEMTFADGPDKTFRIWVTNVGGTINFPAGGLTVTDAVPAGMTVLSVTASNWNCAPATVVGPGTLTCTYNLGGSLAAGAQLPDGIVLNTVVRGEGPIENCATVAIGAAVGVDANPANNKACVPVTRPEGSLIVRKTVRNNSPIALPNLSFPMTVSCSAPSGMTQSFTLTDGGSRTVSNIAVGSTCTVAEAPLPVPAGVCPVRFAPVWATPVMTPPSATISGTTATITVQNTLDCVRATSINVVKELKNSTAIAIPNFVYPVRVSCTAPSNSEVTLSLVHGVPQSVGGVAFGSVCTITEGTLPLPNVCPAGFRPVWSTPVISPASVTVSTGSYSIKVANTLSCERVSIIACTAPKILRGPAPGVCECPPGMVQRGETCVTETRCVAPKILRGPAPGACECPPGTTERGRRCVPRIECGLPQIPNAAGTACICPPPLMQRGRECVRQPDCQLPMIPAPGGVRGSQGQRCICPPPLVQQGRECVRPKVCNPPARLNRRGECECPPNMVARGNSCIEQRRPPGLSPGAPRDPRGGQGQSESPGRR